MIIGKEFQSDMIINDDSTSLLLKDSLSSSLADYQMSETSSILSITDSQYSKNEYLMSTIHNIKVDNQIKLKKVQSASTNYQITAFHQFNDDNIAREKLFKQLEQNYQNHKIDHAYQLAKRYREVCAASKINLTPKEINLLQIIEDQMKDVYHYQKTINQDGWTLQKEKKNLKVSTKVEEKTVGVMIQAFLDAPIENFLSVLIQIDLMKKIMPFMAHSRVEKIVSRNCRIGHCINDFPILSQRQAFFQGIGYDRMDHNRTVLLYTRSLNDRPDLQQLLGYKVQQTKDAIQLDYRYLIIQYRPTTATQGTMKMALNIDLKLSVPMWILMPATQGFGVDFYKNVLKVAKDFKGSEWEKRAKENPAFFNLVHRRVQELFIKQNAV